MNKLCEFVLEKIVQSRESHLLLAKGVISADSGKMYSMDLLVLAALKRSMSVCAGFSEMIRQRNYLCAASLIRFQLDSCLRLYASTLVDDLDCFAQGVMAGSHVRKMKDREGKPMTDSYLVEKLSASNAWISSVYEETSGFIHFSDKHIFSAAFVGEKEGSMDIAISDSDGKISDDLFADLSVAFLESTKLLLYCVGEWVSVKEKNQHSLDPSFLGKIRS
jgi:hypothetical protein